MHRRARWSISPQDFSRLSIAIPQARLKRYGSILSCPYYPKTYDSVDVTLTNLIIADSPQPPEVARTLVTARITPTQQCLDVKVAEDLWLSNLRGCSTTNKMRVAVRYTQDRHCTGSNIICKLSWRNLFEILSSYVASRQKYRLDVKLCHGNSASHTRV